MNTTAVSSEDLQQTGDEECITAIAADQLPIDESDSDVWHSQ